MSQKLFDKLLSERDDNGEIRHHPYSKWRGAHWVLSTLADLNYPPGDKSLIPLREQVLSWLLSVNHLRSVQKIAGKYRRCASQEGNALYSLLKLELDDERCDELAKRLKRWQWPDGGWNCDVNPKAHVSSFHESLIPLRALSLFAKKRKNVKTKKSVETATELFLSRKLYKKKSDGTIIKSGFAKLHYPPFWHYDFLFGLKVMAEAGYINDPRCKDALDLLESKRLPDGGFPAEAKYYNNNSSKVDWGGVDKKKSNEFVTKDALFVLKKSGRLK